MTNVPSRQVLPRRSTWTFPALVGTWLVVYFGARAVLEQAGLPVGVRAAVAVVPAIVFVLVLIVAVRAIRAADELEQRIHLLATAIAYPLVATVILLLGLLDRANILSRQSLTDLVPFFTTLYIGAYVFARWHYHPDESAGEEPLPTPRDGGGVP